MSHAQVSVCAPGRASAKAQKGGKRRQEVVQPVPAASDSALDAPATAGESAAVEFALAARIAERLAKRIGADGYERYFNGHVNLNLHGSHLEVLAATRFMAGLLDRRFGVIIKEVAREEQGGEVEVSFGVNKAQPLPRPPAPDQLPQATRHAARTSNEPAHNAAGRGARYRLEDFVVGDSNRLAYDAALRLTESGPAPRRAGSGATAEKSGCSPLFIHGICGMGKTHLLQGIAVRFKERHPDAVVRCTTGEEFTNEFITAVRQVSAGSGRSGGIEKFRKSYRNVDLLCIDDVHFLANKQATQAELLHTFDVLNLAGARVVLASDEHPRVVKKFTDALVSRFMCGMVARLDTPDRSLCERLVRKFAERRGLIIEDAAVRSIAARVGALPGIGQGGAPQSGFSVREIEGALTRVEAFALLVPEVGDGNQSSNSGSPRRIGMLVVQRALGLRGVEAGAGVFSRARSLAAGSGLRVHRPVRLEQIVDRTCAALGVSLADLTGRGRHKRVVLARAMITYLARKLTTLSYPDIARGIGRPNHSTVITAIQRLQKQIDACQPAGLSDGPDDLSLPELAGRLAAELVEEPARQ
jgi:chromosomal replication initiator protein